VVPLSPLVGVIEWVEGTMTFQEYLVGKPTAAKKPPADGGAASSDRGRSARRRRQGAGAHGRYYPDSLAIRSCYERIRRARSKTSGDEAEKFRAQREEFDKICAGVPPAFRFFFVEYFGDDAQTFLDATRAYARSVAANSMVGHVLGIGDRHAQNILLNTKTAEVVHIDFGIAFEQGKLLHVPETVPFRLTRDVVDGFGLQGTDGTFFTTAVDVMNVLRDNAPEITTILQVLVHDPLYRWMVSPRRQQQRTDDLAHDDHDPNRTSRPPRDNNTRRQREPALGAAAAAAAAADNTHQSAGPERVLLRVKQKLQGYTDVDAGQVLSVEGQVTQLIAEAQDPDNLCRIFEGWSAFL